MLFHFALHITALVVGYALTSVGALVAGGSILTSRVMGSKFPSKTVAVCSAAIIAGAYVGFWAVFGL